MPRFLTAQTVLPVCAALSVSAAAPGPELPFNADTTVAAVLADPDLGPLAYALFPDAEADYAQSLNLQEQQRLLPYHSCLDAESMAEVLNELKARVQLGEQVFYPLTVKSAAAQDEAAPADPAIPEGYAGPALFFFKGRPGAPFAVICAGGGFAYVGSLHESLPLALDLSRRGINVFALHYTVGGAEPACRDLAAALKFIEQHAAKLQVTVEGYALWGGSAGARMAAFLGSLGPGAFNIKSSLPPPAAVIMQYTGHQDLGGTLVPTWAVVGERDAIAPPYVMARRIQALQQAGVPAQLHVYPGVGHGFGLGLHTSAEGWQEEALKFWRAQVPELFSSQ